MPRQLIQILPSHRTKNRVWLVFNDATKIPFLIDDVVVLGLKTRQEINDDLFNRIKNSCLYYLLYNYSLNQIALSPKISQTLTPKIRQKLNFYQRKYQLKGDYVYLVDQIIDKLSSLKLLDENNFAEHLLQKNRKHSRQYISRLFSYYHLSLPVDYSYSDTQNIKAILSKKKYQSLNLSVNSVKNKLISSLLRKGFAYDDIKIAIDEMIKNG